jgi:hypothetical protein
VKTTNILLAAILAITVVACNKQPETAATTSEGTMGDMGTQKAAGPFKVVLMSPGELKPGNASFMAHVTKDGKDVPDAKVGLDLSMPSMNMDGPHVDLNHTQGNAYEGNVGVMASPYAAKVNIESPAGKGSAEFNFTVK